MISMVTCIWNRANLFDRTLFSLARQEHKYPWELIIMDDGSTDNLYDVLKKYRDLPMRVFRTNRPQYSNVAWPQNCGIKQAKGEHILYSSPEVIHYGDTLDFMHRVLDIHDHFVFANVYGLTEADNQWLEDDLWREDADYLPGKFGERGHLCGPKNPRMLYFLAGWRKDRYIQMGGMDERFIYVGYEDEEFMDRVTVPINRPNFYDPKTQICGFHQWHPRLYGDAGYARCLLHSKTLCESIRAQHILVANRGKEWGIIDVEDEVNLETI
jgi:hypothetical protein